MNGNLGALNKIIAYEVFGDNNNSNKIIHEVGLTVQPLDESSNLDAVASENLSDGKANKKRKRRMKREDKKATIIDKVLSIDQTKMEEGSIEGNETEKRNKEQKSKKAEFKYEVQSSDQNNMDAGSTKNLAEGNVAIKKPTVKDEVQSVDQTRMDTGSTKNLAEGNLPIKNPKIQYKIQSTDQIKMDTVPTDNLADGNVTGSRKKKRKSKAKIKDEVQREMDTGSTENLAEGVLPIEKPKIKDYVHSFSQTKMNKWSTEYLAEGIENIRNPKVQDEIQSMDCTKMDFGPTGNSAEGHVTRKRKKKRKSKEEINVEVQNELDTESTEKLAEGNVTIEKPKIRDDFQSILQANMDTGSTEILAEGIVIIKSSKTKDESRSMDQTEMDTGPTESSAEGIVTGKRKKKRKRKVKIKDEVESNIGTGSTENLAQGNVVIEIPKIKDEAQSMDQTKMDTWPTESSAEGNVTGKSKKKRKSKAKIKDEVRSDIDARPTENLAEGNVTTETPKTEMDAWSTETLAEGNVTIENPKIQDEAQSIHLTKMEPGPTENSAEGNVTRKRKKRRKSKAKIKDEVQSVVDTRPTESLSKGNVTTKINDEIQSIELTKMDRESTQNFAGGNVTIKNPKIQDEAQNKDQTEMDTGPIENSAEGNVTGKRKRKKKRTKKAKFKGEIPSKTDIGSTENLAEGNATIKKSEVGLTKLDTCSTENLAEGNMTVTNPKFKEKVQSMDKTKMDRGPTGDFAEGNVTRKRKRKKKRNRKAKIEGELQSISQGGSTSTLKCEWSIDGKIGGDCISNCGALACSMELERKQCPCESESQHICHPHLLAGQKEKSENGLNEVCHEIILDKGKCYAEGTSAISTCDVRMTMDISSFNVKDVKDICQAPITSIRRKLLVLDVNGLLADIVYSAPKHCRGDVKIFGRAVFKRPFCDDFLKFCFQNFDVGIWSSRSKKIIDQVVNYLLGDQKDKLLFCWDMDYATKTGFNTLENKHKPLVCKELRKIWGSDYHNLPWKKGDYNESNTLLLDDSPYKALLNPLYTAIFPSPYQYHNKNDDSLGTGGDLRVYLQGLLTSENVQKYVEQHPFGQRPITEKNCSWEFYSRVLHKVSNPVKGKTSISNTVKCKTPMSN